ncbi:uncharacterized protein LOC101849913 isoform X2 [Aplysia californica]|uniref:Uncharacterized protein LOC101849913 isoform X2 n=1 Tax=Aplysia californica TaxID=6500 RepID=A0ABM0JJ15_APLCA|nr:uncharacterized protein LOC101849913 isoform X2 [Aplysia californica]
MDATAKKKWAVLRDSFRKHHKKKTTFKSGSGGKGPKKWYLYNNLLFLVPFVDGRSTSTTSNLVEGLKNEQECQRASFHQEETLDDNLSSASPGRPNSSSLEDSRPGPSCTPNATIQPLAPLPKKKRPHSQARQDSLSPFDVEMLNALKVLQKQRKARPDDDEQFLLSLLPALKSLDPVSKFELRGELNATALKYLRRTQQPSQSQGQGHPSRLNYQQSPSSVTTEDSFQDS